MKHFLQMGTFALCAVLCSGCMTIVHKDGDLYQPQIPRRSHSLSRNISFSVSRIDNFGLESGYDHEDYKEAVRQSLLESGLFDSVRYARLEKADAHHLHFNFEQSGMPDDAREGLSFLSGLTAMTVPFWFTMDLNASASVIINQQEVDCYHAKRVGRDIYWLPLVVTSPFCNHYTTGRAQMTECIGELVEQVGQNRR